MDQVPLAQAAQPELSFHPLPGASSSVEQIPEMLLTPSRPQARDWEALARVSPGGGGGRGKEARVIGRPPSPTLCPNTAGGTALAWKAPAPTQVAGTPLRRPQSTEAIRSRPPRVPGAAPHHPACKASGAESPESASPQRARARGKPPGLH